MTSMALRRIACIGGACVLAAAPLSVLADERPLSADQLKQLVRTSALAGHVHAEWLNVLQFPDGARLPIGLPGQRQTARDEGSGVEYVVFSDAQAATIALVLVNEGKDVEWLPQILSDLTTPDQVREEPDPKVDPYQLCLRTIGRERPINVELDGPMRFAVRDDGARLLRFTPAQAEELFGVLRREAGLTLVQAAGVLAGFRSQPAPVNLAPGQVVVSGCGDCTPSYACLVNGKPDCCANGQAVCQSCTLCPRSTPFDVVFGD